MKVILLAFALLVCSPAIYAQSSTVSGPVADLSPNPAPVVVAGQPAAIAGLDPIAPAAGPAMKEPAVETLLTVDRKAFLQRLKDADNDRSEKTAKDDDAAAKTTRGQRFHWKPALIQSGIFLGLQHAFRFTEEKTRAELDGPFFRDWKESVQNLKGWDDGGKKFTNYIAHPMQGALTSRIFINNSDKANQAKFGKRDYWESRLKAMAWSAVWSTQFEIGPISEASLGNVGQKLRPDGSSKMTYIDFVVTPVLGTGFAIAEDAVDTFMLENWIEKKSINKGVIRLLRSVLTPTTSIANLLRAKPPWARTRKL